MVLQNTGSKRCTSRPTFNHRDTRSALPGTGQRLHPQPFTDTERNSDHWAPQPANFGSYWSAISGCLTKWEPVRKKAWQAKAASSLVLPSDIYRRLGGLVTKRAILPHLVPRVCYKPGWLRPVLCTREPGQRRGGSSSSTFRCGVSSFALQCTFSAI